MKRSCFNCLHYSSCPIIKGANTEDYDGMYEVFITEFSKHCVDFKEK